MPERERNYQAEVHFALGTIIQGVTVAALGDEIAAALRSLPFPGASWTFLTGFQSLLLCILFWFTFVDHYFFGFRVIRLTAQTHFMFAVLYLILGLLQLIAIRFLDIPHLWMTVYVLLIATTLIGSWLLSRVTLLHEEGARSVLEYDPGSKAFVLTFFLSLGCIITWYALPGLDSDVFRAVALSISGIGLVIFAVYSIRVFQRHLTWLNRE